MRERKLLAAALVALALGTGPTVGDVGGCGATAEPLSVASFAKARKQVDCQRCQSCGLTNLRCRAACDSRAGSDVAFASSCRPLVTDGEVCLHALQAASCDDYAIYIDDAVAAVPTECEFCRGDASQPAPVLIEGGP